MASWERLSSISRAAHNRRILYNAEHQQSKIQGHTFLLVGTMAKLPGQRLVLHLHQLVILLQRQDLHFQILPMVAFLG